VHLYFWLYFSLLAVSRTICSVVTCEGGIYLLSYNPLPSQNPRSPGTSPLGLTSLNRKNLPIEVTLGGIGSVTPVCLFTSIFYPNYKLCDNILAPLSGNTESNFPQRRQLSVSLASRVFILQAYLATPPWVFSLIL
jgi:hypothetical protein